MNTLEEKRALSKWFAAKANWFVLFVQTFKEREVADRIQSKLDNEKYVVFVPTRDRTYIQKDKSVLIKRVPLFGGYVFIATTDDEDECLSAIAPLIEPDSTVYKFLRNGGKDDAAKLTDRDKAAMTALLNEEFNIPALEAVNVGDRVEIVDRRFEEIGEVVKVNKRRQTAILRLELFGRAAMCEVALEFLAKEPEADISNKE